MCIGDRYLKSVFWDEILGTLVEIQWHFRGTLCVHLHGRATSQPLFYPEDGIRRL